MSKPKEMWKTTIVIWTDENPEHLELSELAREAESGSAYCSRQKTQKFNSEAEYTADPDWDDTEFFGVDSGD